MTKRKKQFIAGAVCPKCSDMDSLVLFADDQSVECVSCDYKKSTEQRDQKDSNKVSTTSTNNAKFKNADMINITNLDK